MAQVADALTGSYLLLCDAKHTLQVVHDLQTHSLPAEEELERCAIRMGYGAEDHKKAAERFLVDHQQHTTIVNRTFRSLFSEPKTAPVLKAALRLVGARPHYA